MDWRGIGPRERAGIRIAARHHKRMVPDKNGIIPVPSQSNRRGDPYEVTLNPPHCNCPDHLVNRNKCKHIWAAELLERADPRIAAETQVQPVRPPQVAYPRDWRGYNEAKENKILEFDPCLYDLCRLISPELTQKLKRQRGRPPVPIEALVFAAVYKIFLRMPGRDLTSILIKLRQEGYLDAVMHWNTISRTLIPLSQVDQYLGLAGRIRNGARFGFFGRS
jgi:SWIM zinc finger